MRCGDTTLGSPRLTRDELHLEIREHHALENLELRERNADLCDSLATVLLINSNLMEANRVTLRQRDDARRALARLTASLGFDAEDRGYQRGELAQLVSRRSLRADRTQARAGIRVTKRRPVLTPRETIQ